jgi:hypothetical protein
MVLKNNCQKKLWNWKLIFNENRKWSVMAMTAVRVVAAVVGQSSV